MTQKHFHKLKRLNYKNKEQIYFCTLDCKFRINVKAAIGKKVLCNRCEKPFIMNELSIRQAKPHCNDCTKKKTEQISISSLVQKEKDTSNLKREDKFTPIPEPRISSRSVADDLSDLRRGLERKLGDIYNDNDKEQEHKDSTTISSDEDIL